MIVSGFLLSNYKKNIEEFKLDNGKNDDLTPTQLEILKKYFYLFVLILLIELVLFIWAVTIAVQCNKGFFQTALHIFLACLSPLLYIIIMKASNYCSIKKYKNY